LKSSQESTPQGSKLGARKGAGKVETAGSRQLESSTYDAIAPFLWISQPFGKCFQLL